MSRIYADRLSCVKLHFIKLHPIRFTITVRCIFAILLPFFSNSMSLSVMFVCCMMSELFETNVEHAPVVLTVRLLRCVMRVSSQSCLRIC